MRRAHSMLGSNCPARLYYMPQGEVFDLEQGEAGFPAGGKKMSSAGNFLKKCIRTLELVVNGETELIIVRKK